MSLLSDSFQTLTKNSDTTFNNGVFSGDLTVNGTTTTINTQDLLVEDKNIIIGNVTTPSDITADGGGITLLGITNKTITWIDATDSWDFNQSVNLITGTDYRINNISVLNDTTLGSSVINSSLTSVGTITTGIWNGSVINEVYGGTGQITYTTGDILYSSATNTLSKLSVGVDDQVLTLASGIPSWLSIPSVTSVSFVHHKASVDGPTLTAVGDTNYWIHPDSTVVTVQLPTSPSSGTIVIIDDYRGTSSTSSITVNIGTGDYMEGVQNDSLTINVNGSKVEFVYYTDTDDSTFGWRHKTL